MLLLTRLRLLILPYVRSMNAPLEKKYMKVCPWCSLRGEEHPGVSSAFSVPESWTELNRVYLFSCYNLSERIVIVFGRKYGLRIVFRSIPTRLPYLRRIFPHDWAVAIRI